MNIYGKQARKHIARLFKNGRSQAVRIPKEFEFDGSEVVITQDDKGNLVLEPMKKNATLLELLATLEPLDPEDQFPEIDDSDLLPLDDIKL